MNTFLGYITTSEDNPTIKITFDDIEKQNKKTKSFQRSGGWLAFGQHYFISALITNPDSLHTYSLRKNNQNQYLGSFTSSTFTVRALSTSIQSFAFYAGPKDLYELQDVSPNLALVMDYGWLGFLATPMNWWLRIIYSYVGNYGISIILLTLSIKVLFYKLSSRSYVSIANNRRLMPKIQLLKETYGDDKAKLQKATMELYKQEKINPLGGCLPLLVQMPVFISLYWVLNQSVEMRHAPFMFWLQDLSVMDPYFVLPILMGLSMLVQQRLSPAVADPMQAKIMKIMPVIMTAFFILFPAGLVLYSLTNNMIGILQQWYVTQKIETAYRTVP